MNERDDLYAAWAPALASIFAIKQTGNAVAIGNAFVLTATNNVGLFLTAFHNVQEVDRLAAERSPFKGYSEAVASQPHFESRLRDVIGLRQSPLSVVRFRTFHAPGWQDFDVAAILGECDHLDLRFGLKLIPPEIGTTIVACGLSGFRKRREEVDEIPAHWEFTTTRTIVVGKVIGSYMRRAGITPGPCFEIEGHFPSGLSGAPVVVDVAGQPYACGVVSSSTETHAVASMLWPALALAIPVDLPGGRGDRLRVGETGRARGRSLRAGSLSCRWQDRAL